MKNSINFNKLALLISLFLVLGACQSKNNTAEQPAEVQTKPAVDLEKVAQSNQFSGLVDQSIIYVTATKNGTVPVKASLNIKDSSINLATDATPAVQVNIDIASYDSGLPLRNDRVVEYFFQALKPEYKTAQFSIATLDPQVIAQLRKDKKVSNVPVEGDLQFYGQTKKVKATLDAAFNDKGNLVVKTTAPIEIKVSEWNMTENLKTLTTICQHNSIEDVVKVELNLEFLAK